MKKKSSKIKKTPDDLFNFYSHNKKLKLTVKLMKEDKKYVFIEGNRESLKFLGELLISQAEFKKDCSVFFSPSGPGFKYFSKQSKLGIYIHRFPCEHKRKVKLQREIRNDL